MARAAPGEGVAAEEEGRSRAAGAVLGGERWISLEVVEEDLGAAVGGDCGGRWGRQEAGVGAGRGH